MSAVSYDPTPDIEFFIRNERKNDEDLPKNDVDARINSVSTHLFEIQPKIFKDIPVKFKIRIFERLQKEGSIKEDQSIVGYLSDDDELASALFKAGLFKNAVSSSYLHFSPNGDRLTIHSKKLTADQIAKILESIPLEKKKMVTSLDVSDCTHLKDLNVLDGFSNLTTLNAFGCPLLQTLAGVAKCTVLASLNIHTCGALTSLNGIEALGLQSLIASGNLILSDIKALTGASAATLETLNLSNCPSMEDYTSVLEQLTSLKSLKLRHVVTFVDLNFCANMSKLSELDVDYSRVQDIRGIFQLTHLKMPKFTKCEDIDPAQYSQLTVIYKSRSANDSKADSK